MKHMRARLRSLMRATVCMGLLMLAAACSPRQAKVYHVGILSGLDYFYSISDGFRGKLADLGYAEGKNIVYNTQKSAVDISAYTAILKKFVADKVDLIFVFPTEASMIAKSVTKGTGIPVVAANVFLENLGLVNSIREPGENITGVCWFGPDMALKRLEILRELLPRLKRVWVPNLRDYPIVACQLDALRKECAELGITLTAIPADNAAELAVALQKLAAAGPAPDAILNISEPLSLEPESFTVMAKFAADHGIPIGGVPMSASGYESVFGFIPQNLTQGRQAAFLADKILRGIPAGTIPVVSAENYFQFNYRAAKKLGLQVDEGLLSRADEVIR